MLEPIRIIERSQNKEALDTWLAAGASPIEADYLSRRDVPISDQFMSSWIEASLSQLMSPVKFKDMAQAAARVAKAIINQEVIGLETDHDCDGQTSHAVLHTALVQYFGHPKENIASFIGHRMQEGYGLSESVKERILSHDPLPTLIITADNGSTDEPRIADLKANGIDVIVTDHHAIPESGVPASAYATINPTQAGCEADGYIAGCAVAWYLMVAVQQQLIKANFLKAPRKLSALLDFVAVGTVADCVSMAKSLNNRIIVRYGLARINRGSRPAWRALQLVSKGSITEETLGFTLGPLLNSDGRLDDAFQSVSFLLSASDQEAAQWIGYLKSQNEIRKGIQKELILSGTQQAFTQVNAGKKSLAIFLSDGHAGVHGIAASRLKDQFGRPIAFACPKATDATLITASLRSIDGLNIRSVLQTISEQDDSVFVGFGGHEGAAGMTIHADKWESFTHLFEQVVTQALGDLPVGPEVLVDGPLPTALCDLFALQAFNQSMGPFGRQYEPPLYHFPAKLLSIKTMGDAGQHIRIQLEVNETRLNGVWFNVPSELAVSTIDVPCQISVVGQLSINHFNGNESIQLMLSHFDVISELANEPLTAADAQLATV